MTPTLLLGLAAGLACVNLVLLVLVLARSGGDRFFARLDAQFAGLQQTAERTERSLRDDLASARRDNADWAGGVRRDVTTAMEALGGTVRSSVVELGGLLDRRLGQVETGVDTLAQRNEERIAALVLTNEQKIDQLRQGVDARLAQVEGRLETLTARNDERLAAIAATIEQRLEAMRTTVESRLDHLQRENAARLDEMRATVDEKLQSTLERRLGESFKLVSDRLEQVHRGLGEMQTLASGVGDLKKVLSNVKTRGTWGEVQLRTLLEQGLSPEQFAENVATREGSAERVEFVVRLPGRDDQAPALLLPIDAKFPVEDYLRLVEAAEAGDAAASEAAAQALETRVKQAARDIRDKYVNPPRTTDFAILFLPTEGLYAEVLRRQGLCDRLQRDYRVVVAGPTTLWAFITSLQMGFRTLAIQRHSSEVWELLGRVKADFTRFGEALAGVQKKLQEASHKIDEAQRGTRRIQKTLSGVEALPAGDGPAQAALLPAAEPVDAD